MYATVRNYKGDQSLADSLAARADEVRSVIGAVPGMRAYLLLKTADGTASVTVCDDQAGADESNRVAADYLRQNLPDASVSPPEITGGEVVISV